MKLICTFHSPPFSACGSDRSRRRRRLQSDRLFYFEHPNTYSRPGVYDDGDGNVKYFL